MGDCRDVENLEDTNYGTGGLIPGDNPAAAYRMANSEYYTQFSNLLCELVLWIGVDLGASKVLLLLLL